MRELERISGVDDLYTLMQFLDNRPEFNGYIKKMETLRTDLNTRIKAVGKISEIDAIMARAGSDRQMAGENLAKAKKDAQVILDEADEIKKKALAATRLAKKRDDAVGLREQAIKAAQSAEDQQLRTRELAADKAVKEAARDLARGKAKLAEGLAIKADYQARLDTLESAIHRATG